jgi:hypothetical protein
MSEFQNKLFPNQAKVEGDPDLQITGSSFHYDKASKAKQYIIKHIKYFSRFVCDQLGFYPHTKVAIRSFVTFRMDAI